MQYTGEKKKKSQEELVRNFTNYLNIKNEKINDLFKKFENCAEGRCKAILEAKTEEKKSSSSTVSMIQVLKKIWF